MSSKAKIADCPQAIWDRPVFKNGTVSIPKPILDALGNPQEVRFSIEGKQIVLKKIEKTEVRDIE